MSRPRASLNAIERLSLLPEVEKAKLVRTMRDGHLRAFDEWWERWAHTGQMWPDNDWLVWLIRAGRGFGKTRAGAEWVSQMARETPKAVIALVGGTLEDVRRVMIEGPAGLLAVAHDGEKLDWRITAGEIDFPSGARAIVYSAEAPEKLRGPEHHFAWCDELAKWRLEPGERAWDNLMMGLRGGDAPRAIVTTTPGEAKLLGRVKAMRRCHETSGRTYDNPHLPASFVEAMVAEYAGTRKGRQELDGELIDEVEGALWSRDVIERQRVRVAPELVRVVVGVDPPASSHGDACGIVAVGQGRDGALYVIEDASVRGATPEVWARAVAACAARNHADRVVAEKNQGGDMVSSTLLAADAGLPVKLVSATKGKAVRAEPVSLLYERGTMYHIGVFPALEDELCGLQIGGGYQGPGRSPDRADALVWAAHALMKGRGGGARVRGL